MNSKEAWEQRQENLEINRRLYRKMVDLIVDLEFERYVLNVE